MLAIDSVWRLMLAILTDIDAFYRFARGPLAMAALIIFAAGLGLQVVRFWRLTRRTPPPPALPRSAGRAVERPADLGGLIRRVRQTVLGTRPVTVTVTTVFHVCLFSIPIFLMSHNLLLDEVVGVSLCPYVITEETAHVLTGLLLGCMLFFWGRRLLVAQVRAITTFYDYFILLAVAAPFVSGVAALHLRVNYEHFILVHILSAELLLVLIPFTKPVHMVYFFLYRLLLGGEYAFGRGRRAWHPQPIKPQEP
jgi:nitrate reductase gamma subunit